jgi:tetratricopeptide (TPR) repeat protein
VTTLHTAKAFLAASLLSALSLAFIPVRHVRAQEAAPPISDEAARGLSLFKSGDAQGAVNALRARVKAQADDAYAWHYLGMISMKGGDLKSAIQSFQAAVKLRPDFTAARTGLAYSLLLSNKPEEAEREAGQILKYNRQSDEAHYIISDVALKRGDYRKALDEADAALEIQPQFKAARDVKTKALFVVFMGAANPFLSQEQESGRKAALVLQILGGCCLDVNQRNIQLGEEHQARRLAAAAEVFEKSLKRTPALPEVSEWREDLETLIFWRDYFDPYKRAGRSKLFEPQSVTTNVRVLHRPNPTFAREEIQGLGQAKVLLRAVMTETGEVKHVMVLKPLGYELTRRAMAAARQIRFEPAKKEGAPVPVITLLEYDFKEMAAADK